MSQRIVITPDNANKNYWKDLWSYRGLFYFLAWRDVKVRYKQTAVGVAWSVLRPLLTIGIFWFIGWLFNLPDDGVPRILMVTAATLPWQFFSTAFSESAGSLVANSNLMTKVYFPRIIVPVSTVIVCLIDFLISFAILVVIMLVLQFNPGWQILLLPLFLLFATVTAMGAGLLIAALNVKYRDFRYIIPFIVQFGLYISPVAFSSSAIFESEKIPTWIKFIYSLNPMVGVIDGFRWCITGGNIVINQPAFISSIIISLVMLVAGVQYFRKTEKTFADII
ncbi:MAG TPA: ABC transporter permease [Flavobacteriales bacterium]|jgi:lipopolysaccharide transport system permease protein